MSILDKTLLAVSLLGPYIGVLLYTCMLKYGLTEKPLQTQIVILALDIAAVIIFYLCNTIQTKYVRILFGLPLGVMHYIVLHWFFICSILLVSGDSA